MVFVKSCKKESEVCGEACFLKHTTDSFDIWRAAEKRDAWLVTTCGSPFGQFKRGEASGYPILPSREAFLKCIGELACRAGTNCPIFADLLISAGSLENFSIWKATIIHFTLRSRQPALVLENFNLIQAPILQQASREQIFRNLLDNHRVLNVTIVQNTPVPRLCIRSTILTPPEWFHPPHHR